MIDYNFLFSELDKICYRDNCENLFRDITLADLVELNDLLHGFVIFCEGYKEEFFYDLDCGDKVFQLYILVNQLFSNSCDSRNKY